MLLCELFEMAKGKTKRKREAKRTRKDKAEHLTQDKMSNPVAKFAQTSGAGMHKEKQKYSKNSREEGKKETQDY